VKATIIKLTPETRELFKQMKFPKIPEAAKFAAFMEDGYAAFLEDFTTPVQSFPTYTVISSYEVTDLQITY